MVILSIFIPKWPFPTNSVVSDLVEDLRILFIIYSVHLCPVGFRFSDRSQKCWPITLRQTLHYVNSVVGPLMSTTQKSQGLRFKVSSQTLNFMVVSPFSPERKGRGLCLNLTLWFQDSGSFPTLGCLDS